MRKTFKEEIPRGREGGLCAAKRGGNKKKNLVSIKKPKERRRSRCVYFYLNPRTNGANSRVAGPHLWSRVSRDLPGILVLVFFLGGGGGWWFGFGVWQWSGISGPRCVVRTPALCIRPLHPLRGHLWLQRPSRVLLPAIKGARGCWGPPGRCRVQSALSRNDQVG